MIGGAFDGIRFVRTYTPIGGRTKVASTFPRVTCVSRRGGRHLKLLVKRVVVLSQPVGGEQLNRASETRFCLSKSGPVLIAGIPAEVCELHSTRSAQPVRRRQAGRRSRCIHLQ